MKPLPRRFRPVFFLLLVGAVPSLNAADAPFVRRFDFGSGAVAEGWTAVRADSVYSKETGFGFEPGYAVEAVDRGGDALRGDFVTSSRPFLFSVAVPEGTYRVTVTMGDRRGTSSATIKAESRQLMVENANTSEGAFVERPFVVNVRNASLPPPPPNAPGGSEVRLNDRERGLFRWDDKLTIEFNGAAPKVCAVQLERVEVPTIFLAGDSTVTDQPYEPTASWGQMLPRFFKPVVAVANHAESGETLKSFLTELRLDKILSQVRRGDYLFIQFGHNDSKVQWPQTYVEAATTYRSYLRAYIAEARRRGVTPVLVTSMHRRTFDANGRIKNSLGDYPDAVRAVAREENVALIDLQAMSAAFYEALGPDKAPKAFSAGGKDATHHDNYGAYELARCVVQGIRDARLPLVDFLSEDAGEFDPAKPDNVDTFALPSSPERSDLRPRGN
ncbi:rhamnogalacturonan acetylesterase [Opitutaceae bacterium EW11]|nr:rhamnogalacturonan acetylesterase [Opitutaceae bacterium EW11]